MSDFDHVIIGFGLAGAALECELTKRGDRVLVVDRDEPITSSKIAAGLLTPITGRRFATTPGWRELRPAAERFYRSVEAECGESLFHTAGALRLFSDADERERFEARRHTITDLAADSGSIPDTLNAPFGGYRMPPSARLDVAAFLATRRRVVGDRFRIADVEPSDIGIAPGKVRLPDGTIASTVTFCCGFHPKPNPWFPGIRFEAAKGEMLLLRIPGLSLSQTIHAAGIWLAPAPGGCFRAGATYDWDDLSRTPTIAGREWVEERLRRFLTCEFEVVEHLAAVRPIVHGRQPIVETNPQHANVRMINGLGSKGSLHAPSLAGQLIGDL